MKEGPPCPPPNFNYEVHISTYYSKAWYSHQLGSLLFQMSKLSSIMAWKKIMNLALIYFSALVAATISLFSSEDLEKEVSSK